MLRSRTLDTKSHRLEKIQELITDITKVLLNIFPIDLISVSAAITLKRN